MGLTLDPEIGRPWIAALRGGEYRQARGTMYMRFPGGTWSNCALGVLARAIDRRDVEGLIGKRLMAEVIVRNDDKRESFAEIADWLETLLPPEEPAVEVYVLAEASLTPPLLTAEEFSRLEGSPATVW